MKKIDLTGKVFGMLTVVSFIESRFICGRKRRVWKCICECGNIREYNTDELCKIKSCGCVNIERMRNLNKTHGEANKTAEYKAWCHIKDRCYNIYCERYKSYGGRGIVVCDRWIDSYENFLSDMGRKPTKGHSIDRIDVNGNYEPGNCRWATKHQQMNNTQRTVFYTYKGFTYSMKEWANILGYKYKYFHAQLKYKNKTIEELAYGRF